MISQTFELVKKSFFEACSCFMKHSKFLLTVLVVLTLLVAFSWNQTMSTIVAIVTLLVSLLLAGFVYHASSPMKASYTFKDFYCFSIKKILPLMGVLILVSAAIILGLIALILPGIYIALALALSGASLLISDKDVVGALKNSFKIMEGRKIAYFICYALPTAIFTAIPFAVISLLYMVIQPNIVVDLIGLLANNVAVIIATMTQFGYYKKLVK